MIPLTFKKIKLPAGTVNGIVVDLKYKEYYSDSFTPIAYGVPVNADGTIVSSPPVSIMINPTLKYVIRAENLLCGSVYEQSVIINPYCEIGYELSSDSTYCFKEEIVAATPPSSPQLTVAKTNIAYSTCGSYIYAAGWNANGTGASSQITTANSFWVNGAGACTDNSTSLGPLNRSGLWATTTTSNQTVGFAVCITIAEATTYYVAMGCDNVGMVYLDSNLVLNQNETALNTQYGITGSPFKVWHIYPLTLDAGVHVLELIGFNTSGAAAIGCEIYRNTASQIIAATSYSDLNLIFSSKDYIGQPVQLGSSGIGYSCPTGYALQYCESPIVCRKLEITDIKY